MKLITIKNENGEFLFRVAGILIQDNKVLMMKTKRGDAWVLPGGRAEINEETAETVVREFEEELGYNVIVERLVGIIENFNAYGTDNLHEYGMYYLVKPNQDISHDHLGEFIGKENDLKLTFKWIDINSLEEMKVYPFALKRLIKELPNEVVHFINNDINA